MLFTRFSVKSFPRRRRRGEVWESTKLADPLRRQNKLIKRQKTWNLCWERRGEKRQNNSRVVCYFKRFISSRRYENCCATVKFIVRLTGGFSFFVNAKLVQKWEEFLSEFLHLFPCYGAWEIASWCPHQPATRSSTTYYLFSSSRFFFLLRLLRPNKEARSCQVSFDFASEHFRC